MLWLVPYCKDSLFLCQFLQRGHNAKKNHFANYLDHSEMLICCTEDGFGHIFFITIDGGAVAYPLCKDNLFLQIWFGTMQSKAIANVTRRETDFVPCSRRNMVTGSRMELRFGRTDQSPVRKETMAEWRLPRWSHCKLWWKLNVGTISKRKMGNLNLFDISFDFYRLPALYYF